MTDGTVRTKWRVARKTHVCVWCDMKIAKGARYRFQVYSYDGYLNNCHWHEACVTDSRKVFWNCYEIEFDPGTGEQPFPGLLALDAELELKEKPGA